MIAKRRSYAGLQSYLTPPFMESSVRTIYRELTEAVKTYNNLLPADGQAVLSTGNKDALNRASLAVKKLTVKLGIHRELELDSLLTVPYAEEDIQRIENLQRNWQMRRLQVSCIQWGFLMNPFVLLPVCMLWLPSR